MDQDREREKKEEKKKECRHCAARSGHSLMLTFKNIIHSSHIVWCWTIIVQYYVTPVCIHNFNRKLQGVKSTVKPQVAALSNYAAFSVQIFLGSKVKIKLPDPWFSFQQT